MKHEQEIWKQAMKAWAKEIVKWQLENPDKYWLTELCKMQQGAVDSGGSNPPPNPPKPPGV
jgi:hypothetical protein